MVSIIVAASDNNVIGNAGSLPWRLSRDLKNFGALTKGNTLIMGRKTFESIVARLGKPLPDRKTVVVTRNAGFDALGERTAASFEDALHMTKGENVFIGGGSEIYKASLPNADMLYLTRVHTRCGGDTFLPDLGLGKEWLLMKEESWPKDEKNQFDATFQTYGRRK